MYGMIVLNLKSREVMEIFPGVFNNIDEVYTVKENLFSRLSRDQNLLQALIGREGEEPGAGGKNARTLKPTAAHEKGPRAGKTGSRLV